ncbi:CC181 protein, partial [Regulus satrapa]|nr:CC181 protein [Regulus satrapa]
HSARMSEKEDQGDLDQKENQADVGDSPANVEYEDDFEKDTDEEEKQSLGEKENPAEKEKEVEEQIPKAADGFQEDNKEMKENPDQLPEADVNLKVMHANEKHLESGADIEQEHHESATERENSLQESEVENEQELDEGEDEEMKRYVLGRIEEANKELESQASMDQNRERKLKFRDEMGPQAPPPEDAEVGTAAPAPGDVSTGLSELHISDAKEQKQTSLSECACPAEETADGKVLVEKDGKFELLSLCDIKCCESQGILPPTSVSFTDTDTHHTSPKPSPSSPLPDASEVKEMPPSDPKSDSALSGAKDLGKQKAEPATIPAKSSTYTLTPKQKELRKQIELRNERLRREEEERKLELEEIRRRENEIVFRAWLRKKKEQIKEEKRARRAKQLEEMRMKEVMRDPEEAYRLWLKKKHQQYVKERRIEILRRQTEEVAFFPRREECDRAFRDWLRKKREEKQAAELAAEEGARQIRLEARRAKQRRNL